jgi:hypothetical protein
LLLLLLLLMLLVLLLLLLLLLLFCMLLTELLLQLWDVLLGFVATPKQVSRVTPCTKERASVTKKGRWSH